MLEQKIKLAISEHQLEQIDKAQKLNYSVFEKHEDELKRTYYEYLYKVLTVQDIDTILDTQLDVVKMINKDFLKQYPNSDAFIEISLPTLYQFFCILDLNSKTGKLSEQHKVVYEKLKQFFDFKALKIQPKSKVVSDASKHLDRLLMMILLILVLAWNAKLSTLSFLQRLNVASTGYLFLSILGLIFASIIFINHKKHVKTKQMIQYYDIESIKQLFEYIIQHKKSTS